MHMLYAANVKWLLGAAFASSSSTSHASLTEKHQKLNHIIIRARTFGQVCQPHVVGGNESQVVAACSDRRHQQLVPRRRDVCPLVRRRRQEDGAPIPKAAKKAGL
jgi:hypothetical protein